MTTAPLTDRLVARSRPVATSAASMALLDLVPTAGGALSWVRGCEGLVGWGEAARIETAGPDRFARVAQWWESFVAQVDVTDEVGLPGTGPVAFTSIAFGDAPGRSVLVVPEIVVGRRGGVTWITEIGAAGGAAPAADRPVSPVRRPTGLRYSDGQLAVGSWTEAVRAAVARMRDGPLEKVVLAHDLCAVADAPLDPRFLLRGLARRYPACWAFAVDGLVGATPELLLRRRGDRVSSQVLAGTSWPDSGTPGTLLGSAKDRAEHRYAVDSLARTLQPYCSRLSVPSEPGVLQLPNVAHLTSELTGVLDRPPASLLTLAGAVHPTAAVGGTPTSDALELIGELETMDRARYAGPVGWVDGSGDGELGIALRCAELDGSTARLFAGCGIVADSDPDAEVAEAAAKLVPVRDALQGETGGG